MAGSSSSILAQIFLYNFAEWHYDHLNTVQLTNMDRNYRVEVDKDASDYLDPKTRFVRAQVAFRLDGPTLLFPWTARVDRIDWELERRAP